MTLYRTDAGTGISEHPVMTPKQVGERGALYNENDPKAAAWLRELIKQGHIAHGSVDERDIRDIRPSDLEGYTQCHFFAGIGVWSYALRQAGWPDSRPVWTGSCPCQPFSSAGRRKGTADERHLWPHWFHLISECRPRVIFGEQVASKDGLAWLDLVQDDLEGTSHAFAPFDLCAAGFGAPHIRQRIYFAAERLADNFLPKQPEGIWRHRSDGHSPGRLEGTGQVAGQRIVDRLGHPDCTRTASWIPEQAQRQEGHPEVHDDRSDRLSGPGERRSTTNGVGNATRERRGEAGQMLSGPTQRLSSAEPITRPSPTNGFWGNADWLFCRDGKWRPVEPGTFPLAHGAAARVVQLRGYGNAIVAQQATGFIEAYLETEIAA